MGYPPFRRLGLGSLRLLHNWNSFLGTKLREVSIGRDFGALKGFRSVKSARPAVLKSIQLMKRNCSQPLVGAPCTATTKHKRKRRVFFMRRACSTPAAAQAVRVS